MKLAAGILWLFLASGILTYGWGWRAVAGFSVVAGLIAIHTPKPPETEDT